MKIALAMIVKPTEEEGKLLARCLTSIAQHVDGIFITQAGHAPNEYVSSVIKLYGGTESFYQWNDSFADARNHSFAQVPHNYDYILWLDADDVVRNADRLRATIEKHPDVDTFSLWYLYAFDEWKNPIVVHHKTRLIRNDGCVAWAGDLHEDFKANRQIVQKHIEGVEVLHLTTEDRIKASSERNVVVAEAQRSRLPEDPRTYWNLGNAYKSVGKNSESFEAFDRFLELSQSDDEKYIARMRRAEIKWESDKQGSVDELRYAIGTKPDYPDAYILLGQFFYHLGRYADAIAMLKQGLALKPPYYKIIVYNPRDYDFTPLMWLGRCYVAIEQPILALECFKAMLEITPKDERLEGLVGLMQEQADRYVRMLKHFEKLKNLTGDKLKKALAKIPDEFKSHPLICNLRNRNFQKETSTGKDIVFMCGFTEHVWTPQIAKEEGVGGSEEAVIHLAKNLADRGFNVAVYNNCGHQEQTFDGVKYLPFWAFNYRDKQDVVILWRHPKMLDYEINADRIFVDMHDVLPDGEFTEKRMARVTKVFVKSAFHRSLFPSIPDSKIAIIPNGIVAVDFDEKLKRDPYLLLNTSSADRSLSTLIRLFKRVKAEVPEARLKWAYGWGVFDSAQANNPKAMAWKDAVVKELEATEGIEVLGKVSHGEVAKLYQQARIFAYPTEFAEIDCISARKAQAGGAIPVTTNFAALNETVQFGVKVHSMKTKDTWCGPYQMDFALNDPEAEDAWVKNVVAILRRPMEEDRAMREWAKAFDWSNITDQWASHLPVCD